MSEPKTIVVNNETVSQYFGNDGKLSDEVEEGSTLDFQGTITSDNIKTMYINKTVNIISSTKNGVINLNTSTGAEITTGDLTNRFILGEGASGTVLSGITFYNTQLLLLDNIHDITMDSINVTAENIPMTTSTSNLQNIGIVKILSSENITIRNSVFYSDNVTATLLSAFTMPINYEIYNNNFTVKSGKTYMIYLTNTKTASLHAYNNHFYGDSNNLIVSLPINSLIENIYGNITVHGFANNTIKNSNIYYYIHNGASNTIINCTFDTLNSPADELYLYDSNITTFNLAGKTTLINNSDIGKFRFSGGSGNHIINNSRLDSIDGGSITNGNVIISNNNITELIKINNRYTVIEITNNNITGYITIGYSKDGSTIEGNTIYSPLDYTIQATRASNFNVINNYLVSQKSYGDHSIIGSFKTIANNLPTQIDLIVSADNVIYYNESKISAHIPYATSGNVTLIINSKEISVPIVDGYANYTINETYYNIGENEIEAYYADSANEIYAYNSTIFTIDKIQDYSLEIKAENATDGMKTTINVVLTNDAYGLAVITIDNGDYKLAFNRNITVGDNVIDIPGLIEDNYTITVDFSSDIYASRVVNSTIAFNKAVTPAPTPSEQSDDTKKDDDKKTTPAKKVVTLKAAKKTMKIKKSAKKFVLKATVKINGKAKKGLKVTFKFKGKKYTGKTNKKGVAKVTIKKKVIKKLKKGKKYTAKITYSKKTAKTVVKVKK